MTWWMWLLLVAAAGVFLLVRARSAFRRHVREELKTLLEEKHPEITVVSESVTSFELEIPGRGTGTLNLDNLYAGVAMGEKTPEAHREAIERFVDGILSMSAEAVAPLSLETHGDRLMPRLAPEALLAEARPEDPMPHSPSGVPGFVTVYVLDGEASVMYLTESHLKELGIDAAALHERALANLRRTFPRRVVRDVIDSRQLAMVKTGDSFDAARLLLVPEALEEGEALAALIPDRETLALAAIPEDGNWEALRKLARVPASPYTLLDRPLRVTRAGFSLV